MRTALIILGGFALLGMFIAIARGVGGAAPGVTARAALWFLPAWFALAALNMYVGVARAGYSVAQELPIFAVIFALPAAAALLVWWKGTRG